MLSGCILQKSSHSVYVQFTKSVISTINKICSALLMGTLD